MNMHKKNYKYILHTDIFRVQNKLRIIYAITTCVFQKKKK